MQTALTKTDQQDIQLIELSNDRGDSVCILTLGAIISQWRVATEEHGNIDAVLGYPHWIAYLEDTSYHGAVVGRYCNRISNSQFSIKGKQYKLPSNEGIHHLHGGPEGFHRKIWQVESRTENSLTLSLFSPDGDQGYPGNLSVQLRYLLDDNNGLELEWRATSDRDTVVSLTNHAYFNLAGCDDIRNHQLRIAASHYTPTGPDMIPTGENRPVAGSCLDLQSFRSLESLLTADDTEIAIHGGLDHNWARGRDGEMRLSAELWCPETSLVLQVSSTLPGLQCYTGNHLMAHGVHGCHEGICLEPQYYPNSPNEAGFPSPLLRAGTTMLHRIRFQINETGGEKSISQTRTKA